MDKKEAYLLAVFERTACIVSQGRKIAGIRMKTKEQLQKQSPMPSMASEVSIHELNCAIRQQKNKQINKTKQKNQQQQQKLNKTRKPQGRIAFPVRWSTISKVSLNINSLRYTKQPVLEHRDISNQLERGHNHPQPQEREGQAQQDQLPPYQPSKLPG